MRSTCLAEGVHLAPPLAVPAPGWQASAARCDGRVPVRALPPSAPLRHVLRQPGHAAALPRSGCAPRTTATLGHAARRSVRDCTLSRAARPGIPQTSDGTDTSDG